MLATIAISAVIVVSTFFALWEVDDAYQVTGRIKAWYIDGRDRGDHAWRSACWKPATCRCGYDHRLAPASIIARLQRERATAQRQGEAQQRLEAEIDTLALARG